MARPANSERDEPALQTLREAAPDRLWLGACMPYNGHDKRMMARQAALAERLGIPMLATNDVLYAQPQDRPLHDVVTCIRHGTTIAEGG